jgi:hypothetical protein
MGRTGTNKHRSKNNSIPDSNVNIHPGLVPNKIRPATTLPVTAIVRGSQSLLSTVGVHPSTSPNKTPKNTKRREE